MTEITPDLLHACYGGSLGDYQEWAAPLASAVVRYKIDTPARLAAFLAQIGHESRRLQFVCDPWSPKPRLEFNKALGNAHRGDGVRFRRRGLLPIVGRACYREIGGYLKLPIETAPELLEQPEHAANSAACLWQIRGLNPLADSGHFELITLRVGDGFHRQADRLKLWAQCQQVLGVL